MKTSFKILGITLFLLSGLCFGQATVPSTTLSGALTANIQNNTVCLASVTNILSSAGNYGGIYTDTEYMRVVGPAVGTCVPVIRGEGSSSPEAHASGQTVWIHQWNPGFDTGFRNMADAADMPYGTCVRAAQPILPLIFVGASEIWDCPASTGRWTPYTFERSLFLGPGSCAWSTTGTYAAQVAVATGGPNIQGLTSIGASFVPVNQISLAAAANANTLNCLLTSDIYQPLLNKGMTITGYDVIYGVQTTTLTSINGAAVGTIAFPAPGATETASTVTPVAVGGSLTTSSTTGNMAATTAGAFKNIRTTLGTPLSLSTDLQAVMFTLVFNQTAAAAEVLQTPGIIVRYTLQER